MMTDATVRDMLVRLHRVPPADVAMRRVRAAGVTLRRAQADDVARYASLVEREFATSWHGALDISLTRPGPTAFVANADGDLIGFALWDIGYRGYFGPTGVVEAWRGRGVGAALLLSALDAMRVAGYAYAVIGKVGPAEFYTHVCGAELIAGEPAP
jgi:GNAT superfamily N-acetyltransferase